MTQQMAFTDTASQPPRYVDAFVIFSVTIVSLALGAWFLLRLGLPLWSGMVLALAVYTALLAFHLVVRRSFIAAGPSVADDSWSREAEPPPWQSFVEDARGLPQDDAPHSAEQEAARWAEQARAGTKRLGDAVAPPAQPEPFDPVLRRGAPPPRIASPYPAPGKPALADAPRPPALSNPPGPPGPPDGEVSAELIQDLIKKLADELNSTAGDEQPLTRASEPRAPAAPAASEDRGAAVPSWWPSADGTARAAAGPRPGAPPALNPQLARIAEAVEAERLEVLLDPIHALAEGRPRHFEVSMRLLAADGAALEASDYARAAKGSGLMPRIDAARMVRALRVARRLEQRGRQGSVLTSIVGESLADRSFLDATAAEPGTDGRMGLVLSFAQNEVRAFTLGHAQALTTLAAAGFSFAIDEVTDLDMDFAALKEMGFKFIKLDAPVFLEGLPASGGRIPASDICRHLGDFGFTLIVGRIEDDWLLARILGFGVLFGKGTLFGGPKLVKEEVVTASA